MKIKAKDIYLCVDSINALGAKDLPVNVALKVLKGLEEAKRVFDIVEKQRTSILESYNIEDTNEQSSELMEATKKFNDYLEDEVEIDVDQIDVNDLTNISLSAVQLADIKWILK